MRPLLVSHSDAKGGAARAAWRLQQALVASGLESRMLVGTSGTGDWRVQGAVGKLQQGLALLRPAIDGCIMRLQRSPNPVLHSPGWLGSVSGASLSSAPVDVVNLHWTCGGFLSVAQIGRISKPLVWTLHDMWAFCGAEHYDADAPGARWREGYTRRNRPDGHRGLDLDRWVWGRKVRAWARLAASFVTPSAWLASCASESALLKGRRVSVIPNALDLQVYKPAGREIARQILGLPVNRKIVLFGALLGTADPRKGWDLLQPALQRLAGSTSDVLCVVFGSREPRDAPRLGLPFHWFGHVNDDHTLAMLYSAADVMVVPSRQENLAQSATEAQACGCPVVAFNAYGNGDAVGHGETGYLAKPYEAEDMCRGIEWILQDRDRWNQLSRQARHRSEVRWSMDVVARQYREEFERVHSEWRGGH